MINAIQALAGKVVATVKRVVRAIQRAFSHDRVSDYETVTTLTVGRYILSVSYHTLYGNLLGVSLDRVVYKGFVLLTFNVFSKVIRF